MRDQTNIKKVLPQYHAFMSSTSTTENFITYTNIYHNQMWIDSTLETINPIQNTI